MYNIEVKELVRNILDGKLADAREDLKMIVAGKKRDRDIELLHRADVEWNKGAVKNSK